MEQGRSAVCHALDLPEGHSANIIPVGIYTIPEMSNIGLDEMAARKRYREVMIIGRAKFDEIAHGQISGIHNGLLKMVADSTGKYLLGVQIIGEGATELIHVGQMGFSMRPRSTHLLRTSSTSLRWLKPIASQRLIL